MKNDKSQSRRIQFALAACKDLKVAGLSTGWILKALQADIGTLTTLGAREIEGLVRVVLGAGGIQAVEKQYVITSPTPWPRDLNFKRNHSVS